MLLVVLESIEKLPLYLYDSPGQLFRCDIRDRVRPSDRPTVERMIEEFTH